MKPEHEGLCSLVNMLAIHNKFHLQMRNTTGLPQAFDESNGLAKISIGEVISQLNTGLPGHEKNFYRTIDNLSTDKYIFQRLIDSCDMFDGRDSLAKYLKTTFRGMFVHGMVFPNTNSKHDSETFIRMYLGGIVNLPDIEATLTNAIKTGNSSRFDTNKYKQDICLDYINRRHHLSASGRAELLTRISPTTDIFLFAQDKTLKLVTKNHNGLFYFLQDIQSYWNGYTFELFSPITNSARNSASENRNLYDNGYIRRPRQNFVVPTAVTNPLVDVTFSMGRDLFVPQFSGPHETDFEEMQIDIQTARQQYREHIIANSKSTINHPPPQPVQKRPSPPPPPHPPSPYPQPYPPPHPPITPPTPNPFLQIHHPPNIPPQPPHRPPAIPLNINPAHSHHPAIKVNHSYSHPVPQQPPYTRPLTATMPISTVQHYPPPPPPNINQTLPHFQQHPLHPPINISQIPNYPVAQITPNQNPILATPLNQSQGHPPQQRIGWNPPPPPPPP
ncbi:hypothetical protein BLNAU_13969 [Blattamonas nauphoetae]|uniref:Uncharacterized protein n=1 Tax=Blattamonas nauphoetae TaxID=2049346 RepID=A0ABQ9XF78_9EUKA|nr:hypothetical protein BLNAU_13969 [Blattamonas nauphoetae]